MKNLKKIILLSILVCTIKVSNAQDDLLENLNTEADKTKQYTQATFKATRIINCQTVETLSKNSLDFRISHRFGDFSSGSYNFYGLDGPANIRIGFDYGITDKFMIGIGRSSDHKLFDGFLKYKILSQTTNGSMPITLTGLISINITSEKDATAALTGINKYENFSSRISYMYQLMIARKFTKKLSVQLSPTFIHYNQVINTTDKNDMLSLATAGRFKLTKSLSLSGEYVIRISQYTVQMNAYHNSLGFGLDVETGGHVFQVFVINSFGINEVQAIPYTVSQWGKGEIRLGFNISRVFSFNKSH
ncbi:DUF5777 family beta-barrel protein [Cytophaga aurantiaca]|uniref:DUF5777 family beta-barrel protein n=1 Tax=Cytophaga aurantiaca TaxID=29530 RepID=UPI000362060D|nr:DUF5777 family beta-barrel protein [Cytophaga aurantiaca]